MPLPPRATGFARTILLLWSAALAGCAQAPPSPPADATARLYTRSLEEISLVYIKPVPDWKLILSGLTGLATLDHKLSVAETPASAGRSEIALTYSGRDIALYAPPQEGDAAGWGRVASRAAAAAKTASPAIAALPEERIDAAVLDGMTGALDRFSRYATPRAARARRAMLDGLGEPTLEEAEQDGIAIFRITAFNRDTAARLAAALRRHERGSGLRGVVLDLRGDPGGLLKQAVGVARLFIADGSIVATVGRNPASRQFFRASGRAIAPAIPLVVLIDGGSASASEIVAAALQDAHRAVIVGSASYGKGSVQTVLPLPNGGELIVTWALLVRPSGSLLNRHGVIPNACTDGLADSGPDLRRALSRGLVTPTSSAAQLDEADWRRLRHACPAQPGDQRVDLAVAERLLADPILYREALGDTRRAGTAALTRPSAATLTGSRSPLISASPTP